MSQQTPIRIIYSTGDLHDAEAHVAVLFALGRRPKLYERQIRAEGLSETVFVVVADVVPAAATPTPPLRFP